MKLALSNIALLASLTSATVFADTTQNVEPEVKKSWGGNVSFMSLDSKVATQNGVSDSVTNIELSYNFQKEKIIGAIGFSGFILDDRETFSQVVEDNWGDVSTATSDISAFGFFGEAGYQHQLSNNLYAEIVGGLNISTFERTIANCSDCHSEDLSIDTGLYIKPRIRFMANESISISVAFVNYVSGDFSPSIMFGIQGR